MMASPSELSLDCKPQNHALLLKSLDEQIDQTQTQKIEDFLGRLEEERLKIDAFKRELPLCMQLLNNAVEASRQQLISCRGSQGTIRPILEEFIPLKESTDRRHEEISDHEINNKLGSDNKANWMVSAQLWSQTSSDHGNGTNSTKETTKLGFDNIIKHRNGAFLPFSKDRNLSSASSPNPNPSSSSLIMGNLPELGLAASCDDNHKEEMDDKNKKENENENDMITRRDHHHHHEQGMKGDLCQSTVTTTTTTTNNTQRKARRCWSPDLHRRFVNALQMLGGSQVATPKQIRELMKVDGLTNDEVKSHLQKYRLHTRRPSPSPQAAAAGAPQLVVLGGIWVPQEYATAAHGGGATATLYGAHHASPHYGGVPQEYYQAPTPPQQPHHQLHHQFLHHQLHVYKPPSQTHESPGGNGDRSESIEDGKSESSSWKADSGGGGGGGERMALALREEGEESNGSEITLKF